MTPAEVKRIAPNASKSTINANADCKSQSPEPEHPVCDRPVGKAKRKKSDPSRDVVSITSYRVRAVDPDNLCGKYFVDSLRYAGVLHNDREEDIVYQISQKKVATKAQEKTLIQLVYSSSGLGNNSF